MFLARRATSARTTVTKGITRPHQIDASQCQRTPRLNGLSYASSRPQHAHYSQTSPAPPLTVRNVPAPHLGHIRVLELNRPAARNALSVELLDLLTRQVDDVKTQHGAGPVRALIVASSVDGVFCAGADLKQRRGMSKVEVDSFLSQLRRTFTDLSDLRIPTISALSGTALGGGLELALCTHLRLFSSSTVVGLPETRLGIIPGAGGTHRLPKLIGAGRARDLILTGRRVSGAEAYFLGLCDRLVDVSAEIEAASQGSKESGAIAREKVLSEAIATARQICEGGPVAIQAALNAIGDEAGPSQEAENRAYDSVLKTEDRLEALKAFAEKRVPVFKGR